MTKKRQNKRPYQRSILHENGKNIINDFLGNGYDKAVYRSCIHFFLVFSAEVILAVSFYTGYSSVDL